MTRSSASPLPVETTNGFVELNDLNELTSDLNALVDSETRLRMASVTLDAQLE